jgi:hypothetical protein
VSWSRWPTLPRWFGEGLAELAAHRERFGVRDPEWKRGPCGTGFEPLWAAGRWWTRAERRWRLHQNVLPRPLAWQMATESALSGEGGHGLQAMAYRAARIEVLAIARGAKLRDSGGEAKRLEMEPARTGPARTGECSGRSECTKAAVALLSQAKTAAAQRLLQRAQRHPAVELVDVSTAWLDAALVSGMRGRGLRCALQWYEQVIPLGDRQAQMRIEEGWQRMGGRPTLAHRIRLCD